MIFDRRHDIIWNDISFWDIFNNFGKGVLGDGDRTLTNFLILLTTASD